MSMYVPLMAGSEMFNDSGILASKDNSALSVPYPGWLYSLKYLPPRDD